MMINGIFDSRLRGPDPKMNELPNAGLFEIARVFTGDLHKYICEGTSMNPTLRDGEVVLVDRGAEINVGDIVVARHPLEPGSELLKRVHTITPDGRYFLIGDNLDDSNDSRHFGPVARDYITGKAVARSI
jgi:nickel-type superoxide dismutase maturation protease